MAVSVVPSLIYLGSIASFSVDNLRLGNFRFLALLIAPSTIATLHSYSLSSGSAASTILTTIITFTISIAFITTFATMGVVPRAVKKPDSARHRAQRRHKETRGRPLSGPSKKYFLVRPPPCTASRPSIKDCRCYASIHLSCAVRPALLRLYRSDPSSQFQETG